MAMMSVRITRCSLEAGANVDGGDVVIGVAEPLRVFVHLVRRSGDGQRLLELVAHGQRELQVLLHVLQWQARRERALEYRYK